MALVNNVVKKVCVKLAFVIHGLEYKSRDGMLQVYKPLVRPQLEYYALLVTTLGEGWDSAGADIHRDKAWNGTFQLCGEAGFVCLEQREVKRGHN